MLTLFQNARVYAPEALGVVDILVGGREILAIGVLGPPPTGLGVTVHDLEGRRVIPGLVDVHSHLSGGGGEGGAHTRVPALGPSSLLAAGVTTVVGLLGTDTDTRSIAELLATSRGLDPYGITSFCYTGGYVVPPLTLTGSVRGDLVHVDRIIAVGETAISDHRSSQPSYDELIRLAADAHVSGMMTGKAGLLHLHLGDGRRGLEMVRRALDETELPSRVFHPTHVNRNRNLWAEAVELGRARQHDPAGLIVDVTAFPPEPRVPSAHDDILAWLEAGLSLERLTLSSDGGGCLPVFDSAGALLSMEVGASRSLLDTVRALVRVGLDWSHALLPCTRTAARHFRLRGKGELRVGADADLLVLDAAGEVETVMTGGGLRIWRGEVLKPGLFEGVAGRVPAAGPMS